MSEITLWSRSSGLIRGPTLQTQAGLFKKKKKKKKDQPATLNWLWRDLLVSVAPDNGDINKGKEKMSPLF